MACEVLEFCAKLRSLISLSSLVLSFCDISFTYLTLLQKKKATSPCLILQKALYLQQMFATNITYYMDISITKKPDNLITVLSSLEVGDKIHFARGIYATGYLRSIASQLGQIKGWTLTVRELKGDLSPILVERYADPCDNDQI